jgi:hypothetical protein
VRTAVLLGGLACVALPGTAQQRPDLTVAAGAAVVRLQRDLATGSALLEGPGFAAAGAVRLHGLAVGVEYLGGHLTPGGSGPAARDVVEGRVFLAASPWPWLVLSLGPQVRALVTDSTTERSVFWQARARAQGPLVGPRLASYVELWRAFASATNLGAPLGRAQGGEAGLLFQPERSLVALRLSYRVDDAAIGGGGETIEVLRLGVELGGRRAP